MKKFLFAVIFCMLFLFNAFAQSEEVDEITVQSEEADEITAQPEDADEITMQPEEKAGITISAEYQLSSLTFSSRSIYSGSILTWRDIYLNGAYVNVNFPGAPFGYQKTNIGAGFSVSFNGYWTDDDANNDLDVIYTAEAEAFLLELNYEILSDDYGLNFGLSHKLGLDFIMLFFKNYDAVPYMSTGPFYGTAEGLSNTFDHYKLDFYGGMRAVYGTGVFYAAVSGTGGIGIHLSFGDWLRRTDLKHPVSFSYFGISFRGESDFEIGFRFKRGITLFTKALLMYEISPGLGLITTFSNDDETGIGSKFIELSRASLNVGIKIDF